MDMDVHENVEFIQLDSWNLEILNVILAPAGSAKSATLNGGNIPVIDDQDLIWEVKNPAPNPGTGTVLVVQLPFYYSKGQQLSIQVEYNTPMGGSAGANFLRANQTQDKTDPFFFTYSYEIQGRMIAPQQDTPANRITYGACITTSSNLTVGMSANFTGAYQSIYGYKKSCFSNEIPMANYLMAAVVGNLVQGEVVNYGGLNTYIWAEPSVLGSALGEFGNLQQILQTITTWIDTPYIWGDFYRIVVMPPAYPMAGMANPLLAYTSPTTIVGDGSQEYVLVRDAAQMWMGAQVTPNNWEDTWIN